MIISVRQLAARRRGLPRDEIVELLRFAGRRRISIRTARNHIHNILGKFGAPAQRHAG